MQSAKSAVQKTLSSLPVGTPEKMLEKAKESALAAHKAKIARRRKAQRAEVEECERRRDAEWKADAHLGHVERYLSAEYEFDDGPCAMREEARRLRATIRDELINEDL